MSNQAGTEPHLINHCLRATSVTTLSDHNYETRHIKSILGHKSDQAVESYNEQPLMEQQQNMSLLLSDFFGNASSGSATLVQGKENEIQQQYRGIPNKFPHHEPRKAVLVKNNFSTSSTSSSWQGNQRSFPHYCSVNALNYYFF